MRDIQRDGRIVLAVDQPNRAVDGDRVFEEAQLLPRFPEGAIDPARLAAIGVFFLEQAFADVLGAADAVEEFGL